MRRILTLLLINGVSMNPLPAAEKWAFEGFWENRGFAYARKSCPACPYAEGDSHLQSSIKYQFRSGAFVFVPDLQIDTHHQVRRDRASYSDRPDQRPVLSATEFYLALALGSLDLRVGKQKVIWGRADGFNPTDNVTPFDYLDLVENERIGVNAIRARQYWGTASLDMLWIPVFTPTRLPLFLQRWFPLRDQPLLRGLNLESTVTYPATTMKNSQWALRWDQGRKGWDYSVSYFQGWNDIPSYSFRVRNPVSEQLSVDLQRSFPRLQVVGGDFARVIGSRAVRGEFGFFRPGKGDSDLPLNDRRNYIQYALGTDGRWGDWYAIVQWMGDSSFGTFRPAIEIPGGSPRFPDHGFGQAVLARVEKTLNPWSSVQLNAVLRFRDTDFFLKPEYLYDISQSWKLQTGLLWLAGRRIGFFGQYRENSRLYLKVKRSF